MAARPHSPGPLKRRALATAFVAPLVVLTIPVGISASEEIWSGLQRGGQVVLMRHALTTPGVGDPPGMRLDDCRTQRNLSDEGRRDARQIGEVFRARGIVVDRVLSSVWCRCVETARLAFGGVPEVAPSLANLYGRPENRDPQVAALRTLAGERTKRGNVVMVSHGSTIVALTGVSLDSGEMVVVSPQGEGRFTVVGRLKAHGR